MFNLCYSTSLGPKVNIDTGQSINMSMLKTIKHWMSTQKQLNREYSLRLSVFTDEKPNVLLLSTNRADVVCVESCIDHKQPPKSQSNCTVTWSQEEVLFTHNSTGTILHSIVFILPPYVLLKTPRMSDVKSDCFTVQMAGQLLWEAYILSHSLLEGGGMR